MFAILDDSDNDEPKVKPVAKADKGKKDATPAPAPAAAAPAAKADKPKSDKPKGDKPKADGEARPKRAEGEARPKRAEGEARPKRAEGEERPRRPKRAEGDAPAAAEGAPRERKGDAKDHRHGAAHNGEKKPREGKREFDRRNSTGRSGEQRRGGRGPHGLGNVDQEAQEAEKDPSTAVPEVEDATAPEEEEAAPAEPAAPPTLSFDEFIAKRNEARANTEIFGEVKTREVEADFSGLKVAEDAAAALVFVGGVATVKPAKAAKKATQRSNVKTAVLDVAFKPHAPVEYRERGDRDEEPRAGRGAGGRGSGGRGAGGRGAGRGGSTSRPSSSGAVDINDALSFPSL